jgi:hypothetical protein
MSADDRGAPSRHDARGPAGAGGQIEDSLARLRVQPEDTVLDGVGNTAADLVVVASA